MADLKIRYAVSSDLPDLLALYIHLHDNPLPKIDERIEKIWARIISDENHIILLGCVGDEIVSSCALVIVENLTHGQRPYALIENVITHPLHRKKGYASQILNAAKETAAERGCYKIMLLTGSKKESTLNFYRRAGYNSEDKTGFVRWL